MLVIGAGVALISLSACKQATVGNLMAPVCPDGGIDFNDTRCPEARNPGPRPKRKFGDPANTSP